MSDTNRIDNHFAVSDSNHSNRVKILENKTEDPSHDRRRSSSSDEDITSQNNTNSSSQKNPTSPIIINPSMKSAVGKREILDLRFNQEQNLFACSTDAGLRIYNVDPLAVKASLDPSEVGTISIVELLHRTNLVALVAGGSKQKFAENTVLIWDDAKKQFVIELTFSSPVISIRMRKDRLFVVEKSRIHVFSFPSDPKKLMTLETSSNPNGLCEVTPYSSSIRQVMVYPGHKTGTVQVVDLMSTSELGQSSSAPINITAHQSELACLALNNQGTLVATASLKGTLIRVFDTTKKVQMVELRRGSDPATLYCINFSPDSDFLCASSDKGTIHIFALKDTHLNRRSQFKAFLGQYGESQWAVAKFTVAAECAAVCAFGSKGAVYAICVDGTFHKYVFNQEGSCIRDSFDVFVDLPEEDDF